MMKTETTFRTVVAYSNRYTCWACGRCLNNRGTMLVYQYGRNLWRSDTRKQTTVTELEADGWHRVKTQRWGR
jgi:hypothetical protein